MTTTTEVLKTANSMNMNIGTRRQELTILRIKRKRDEEVPEVLGIVTFYNFGLVVSLTSLAFWHA